MTKDMLAALTDDQLIEQAQRVTADERSATAAVIRVLMELDARKLYLREGCSSLFTYCTQVLRLAEGAAYNRIEAARAARRYPSILDELENGRINLTTVRLVNPHLTDENHVEVIAAARGLRKRQIEELVATLHPRPAVQTMIRRLPTTCRQRPAAAVPADPVDRTGTPATHNQPIAAARSTSQAPAPPSSRPASSVTPLAPERYRLQVTISRGTHEKLRRAQDLLRHSIPSGDTAEILDRSLTLLIADVERRRLAMTESPRPSRSAPSGSRHIPAAVRRAIWRRDGGRCAFVGRNGRCTETAFLEFHHLHPYAAGGAATEENIALRCRAHNACEADLFFGIGVLRERADSSPLACGACELVPERAGASRGDLYDEETTGRNC